jgi:uncharacterized membrane protein YgcG
VCVVFPFSMYSVTLLKKPTWLAVTLVVPSEEDPLRLSFTLTRIPGNTPTDVERWLLFGAMPKEQCVSQWQALSTRNVAVVVSRTVVGCMLQAENRCKGLYEGEWAFSKVVRGGGASYGVYGGADGNEGGGSGGGGARKCFILWCSFGCKERQGILTCTVCFHKFLVA